jgi:hypothetical protein
MDERGEGSVLRRLIAKPVANVVVAMGLLLVTWGIWALPSDTLGDDPLLLLGALGVAFVLTAVLALLLALVGAIVGRGKP